MTAAIRYLSIECTVYTAVRTNVAIQGVRTDGRAGAFKRRVLVLLVDSNSLECPQTRRLFGEGGGGRGQRLRRLGPAGVEADVRRHFGNRHAGQTAVESEPKVQTELVVVAHRGERGDGDQAAIAHAGIGPRQTIVEDHIVGE